MASITPEMIEKAKEAKTAEELLALAKENNIEMTEEEAKTYFAQLHPASGELSDDDLDNVAGGGCISDLVYRNERPSVRTTFAPQGETPRVRTTFETQPTETEPEPGPSFEPIYHL